MSDTALPELAAPPGLSDAPPSVGRSSPVPTGPGPVEQPQTGVSDELKERLDKIVYSEVCFHELELELAQGERAN